MSEITESHTLPESSRNQPVELSALQELNIKTIKNRIEKNQKVHGYMLDACLGIYPHALTDQFIDDDQRENPEVIDYVNSLSIDMQKNNIPAHEVWWHLAGTMSAHVSLTDSFSTGGLLIKDSDITDRLTAPNSDPAEVELIWQISKRLQLRSGILASRLVCRDYMLTAEPQNEPATPDIVLQFLKNTVQSMPVFTTETARTIEKSDTLPHYQPELVVVIPVAAEQERKTLPKTLEALARQSLEPWRFKVLLVHNSRPNVQTKSSSGIDSEEAWMAKLYDEVRQQYPDFQFTAGHIRVAEDTPIGYIRSFGHTSVMSEYIWSGANNNPLILNLDADITTLNKDFLSNILLVGAQTNKPVITSRLLWDTTEINKTAPTAAKLLRFNYFLSRCVERINQSPYYYDCGTAIRLREYCLSGGHYWNDSLAETNKISEALSFFKKYDGDKDNVIANSPQSFFRTNPRRQLDTMLRGYMHGRAWEETISSFGKQDDKVRVNTIDPAELEKISSINLEKWLQEMIDAQIGSLHSDAYKQKRYAIDKALSILGLPSLSSIQTNNVRRFEQETGLKIDPRFLDTIIDPELS